MVFVVLLSTVVLRGCPKLFGQPLFIRVDDRVICVYATPIAFILLLGQPLFFICTFHHQTDFEQLPIQSKDFILDYRTALANQFTEICMIHSILKIKHRYTSTNYPIIRSKSQNNIRRQLQLNNFLTSKTVLIC